MRKVNYICPSTGFHTKLRHGVYFLKFPVLDRFCVLSSQQKEDLSASKLLVFI